MGKKNWDIEKIHRGKSVKEALLKYETSDDTKEAIKEVIKNPVPDNINTVKGLILKDSIISAENRNEVLLILAGITEKNLNFHNCPEDYESRKSEAIYAAKSTQYHSMIMAQRLTAIRDDKQYQDEKDVNGNIKYYDFVDFIKGEIPMGKTTVYNLIDVWNFYGDRVQSIGLGNELQYSKLLPSIPFLKTDSELIDDTIIKNKFWDWMMTLSQQEIKQMAAELKIELGLIEKIETQIPVDVNYKYESRGNLIKIGNDSIELSPKFDSAKARYYKNIIKIVSNNKENGKETYIATIKKGDEKAFKLLERKIQEAKEKGLKLNIGLK